MQTAPAARPVLWRCLRCRHQWTGWDRDTDCHHRPIVCFDCGTGECDLELVIRQFVCPQGHVTETWDGRVPSACGRCGARDIGERSVKGN